MAFASLSISRRRRSLGALAIAGAAMSVGILIPTQSAQADAFGTFRSAPRSSPSQGAPIFAGSHGATTIEGGTLTISAIGSSNNATLILDDNLGSSVTSGTANLTVGGGNLALVNNVTTPVTEVFASTTFTPGLNIFNAPVTGSISIGPGTLQIGNANASTLGSVTLSTGGLLDLNNNSTTLLGVAGTGGTVDHGAGAATTSLTLGANNFNTTFAGVISNSNGGSLTLGSSSLILGGDNSNVIAGELDLTDGANNNNSLLLAPNSGSTGVVLSGGGILILPGSNLVQSDSVVPEPASMALLAACSAGLLARRRSTRSAG